VSSLLTQTQAELVLTLRRGESLLLILGIPLLLLGFFSTVDILPKGNFNDPIDFLFPGIVALAVMSTGMVQLAIGTAFERQYGVLKRLGVTPLGRPRLLTAKTLSIVAIEILQIVLLLLLALALGWSESAEPGAFLAVLLGWDEYFRVGAIIGVVLGTIAFAGLGLLMAGQLKGEVTLAAANGLYLILLLLGGMVIPLSELPTGLRRIAELLPSGALTQILVGTLNAGRSVPVHAWIVLLAWAVLAPLAAARTFRWE
jgi:ABC-2 type transport system permease protein